MKRDAIDFESGQISVLFRKLLIPTLLGTLSMSAMTAIDGMIVGHGVGPIGVAAMFVFMPELLVALLVDSTTVAAQIAIEGFPYYALGVVFFILNVAIIGYYQSIERVGRATLFVLLRGLVLIIPCFMLLPAWLGVKGIWLAMPTAEALTFMVVMLVERCSQGR